MVDLHDPQIMHFTHIDNLAGIVAAGLLADGNTPPLSVECADVEVKLRRRVRRVPIPPGGVVADYVPFYFAPRSPMLYRIFKGTVLGYQGSQNQLVYLGTRVSRIHASNLDWIATDRNAAVNTAEFTNDPGRLAEHIDWTVMDAHQWANTPEDGSQMQRRMAEFLVHRYLPWDTVIGIVVHDEAMANRVADVIGRAAHQPRVTVVREWYF
jgi:hypothetical protein